MVISVLGGWHKQATSYNKLVLQCGWLNTHKTLEGLESNFRQYKTNFICIILFLMVSSFWQHATAPLREVLLIQWFWKEERILPGQCCQCELLSLSRDLAMKHLYWVCVQTATTCLIPTWTHCMPENGTVSMACAIQTSNPPCWTRKSQKTKQP